MSRRDMCFRERKKMKKEAEEFLNAYMAYREENSLPNRFAKFKAEREEILRKQGRGADCD